MFNLKYKVVTTKTLLDIYLEYVELFDRLFSSGHLKTTFAATLDEWLDQLTRLRVWAVDVGIGEQY